MQNSGVLIPTLVQYLMQLPIYLVWLVGIGLALRNRSRVPRASTLAIVAFAIFFVRSLIGTFLNMWLPLTLRDGGISFETVSVLMGVNNIAGVLIGALAWALILWALADMWKQLRTRTE